MKSSPEPGWRAGRRPEYAAHATTTAGALIVLLLTVVSSGASATGTHGFINNGGPNVQSGVISTGLTLFDNGTLSYLLGTLHLSLTDTVSGVQFSNYHRVYTVSLVATALRLNVSALLSTKALFEWGGPTQMPGGSDNLPPFANWTWAVSENGHSDTANWTADSTGVLTRSILWQTEQFTIIGYPTLRAGVVVSPNTYTGATSTGSGFVMSGDPSTTDPDYLTLAQPLAPPMIRWSSTYVAPATWNTATNTVSFSYTSFSPLMTFAQSLKASVYLSIPAGSWGDGNLLPSGMPLNTTLLVNYYGHGTGYLPALTAYKTYVTQLAKDMASHHWTVAYWNIGNEVPVSMSQNLATAFADVFNVGAAAIHSVFPSALVSFDTILGKKQLPFFESHLKGVGFLDVHTYPAGNICAGGTYCPPNNVNQYLRDANLLQLDHNFSGYWQFEEPAKAQSAWFNATGHWLPVLDSEANLNSAQNSGSDPRQQTLFGAALLGAELIDGSHQNMSEELYYDFQSPYPLPNDLTAPLGGWGFGLTSEGANDSDITYAPYDASSFWSQHIPVGSREVAVANSQSWMVRSYAAHDGSNLSLFLVNTGDENATITASVPGGKWVAATENLVDSTTYVMSFNSATQTESLTKDSTASYKLSGTASLAVVIHGYGIAVLTYVPYTNHTSGNGSGGSGSGGSGSGGSGTGGTGTGGTGTGGTGGTGGGTGTGGTGTGGVGGTGSGGSGSGGVGPSPPTGGGVTLPPITQPPTTGSTTPAPGGTQPTASHSGPSTPGAFLAMRSLATWLGQPFVLFAAVGMAGALVAALAVSRRRSSAHHRPRKAKAPPRARPVASKPSPARVGAKKAAPPAVRPRPVVRAPPRTAVRTVPQRRSSFGTSTVRSANRYGYH